MCPSERDRQRACRRCDQREPARPLYGSESPEIELRQDEEAERKRAICSYGVAAQTPELPHVRKVLARRLRRIGLRSDPTAPRLRPRVEIRFSLRRDDSTARRP